ncbi:MAG: hypothetical protein ACYSUI_21000 [Planctomycetota bacterium]|jgi:hypothetical protein
MKHGLHLRLAPIVGALLVCLALSAVAQQTAPPAEQQGQPPAEAAEPDDKSTADAAAKRNPDDESDQEPRTPSQPSAEEIIREFQKQRPTAVPILPSGRDDEINIRRGEEAPGQTRTRPRLPDGSMLFDRTGRITQEGHWWVFLFESDNDSYPEPPMKLLPNRTLERMVRESRGGLDPVLFIVTGEVTDFRGENYLLPRKVLRKRDLGNLKK